MKQIVTLICCICTAATLRAQLVINNAQTPQQLVQNVLLGTGVQVFNVTFTGDPLQIGQFTNTGPNNLGLSSGVLISTGQTPLQGVPNNALGSTSWPVDFNFGQGDADLDAIISPFTTNDAAVLEFDFVPLSDSIGFRYVFASEEYNEYTCSNFNDVFAFIISGPGYPVPTNIALVPGAVPPLPVAINTVNLGVVGLSGQLANCTLPNGSLAYSNLFVDNPLGSPHIEYDGLTVALTASAQVVPCSTYHIKLAIADATDFAFDSGVFLEANSFSSDVLDIAIQTYNPDSTVIEGCTEASVSLSLNAVPLADYAVPVTFFGTAVNGVDYVAIPDTFIIPAGQQTFTFTVEAIADALNEGQEFLQLVLESSVCTRDTIFLFIRENELLTVGQSPFVICSGTPDTLQFFSEIFPPNPPGTFTWSPANGLNNPNSPTPTAIVSFPTTYTVTYEDGTCVQTAQIEVVSPFNVTLPDVQDTSLCGPGTVAFDVTVPPGVGTLTFNIGAPVTTPASAQADVPLVVTGIPLPSLLPGMIGSVCVDITQDTAAAITPDFQYFLELSLVAPNGQVTSLSFQNGSGNGFTDVCFSENSIDPIANYLALPIPPNGTYFPQDPTGFGNLLGTPINGMWFLRVNSFVPIPFSDPAIVNQFSITFTDLNAVTYAWSPAATLTCNDCPTPTASPLATTTYTVTATNAFGCTDIEAVTIFIGVLPDPVVSCGTITANSITFTWPAVPGADGYTVSIDGGAPIAVGNALSYTVNGLVLGQTVNIAVVALAPVGSPCGNSNPGLAACTTNNCQPYTPTITGDLDFCQGTNTLITAQAGFVTYAWSNGSLQDFLIAFDGGIYTLTVTDAQGCTGSASVSLTETPNPVPSVTGDLTPCAASPSQLDAGAGFAAYLWNTPTGSQIGQTVSNGQSGLYEVTVTDASGCTGSDLANVQVIPALLIQNLSEVCDFTGTQYTLSFTIAGGQPATYSVSGVGGTLTGNVFVSVAIPVGNTPTVTVSDASGCPIATVVPTGVCPPSPSCTALEGCFGPNVVVGGNFETFNPNTPFAQFTSTYQHDPCPGSCTLPSGQNILCSNAFAVSTGPQACNPDWVDATDHTTGSGNMMLVDFSTNASGTIWSQTVTLAPNTDYCFGAWFLNLLPPGTNAPLPILRFSVGGVVLGATPAINENEQWNFQGIQFNSGPGGNFPVTISNQNFGLVGFDLAIDDIVVRPLTPGTPPTLSNDVATTCSGAQNLSIPVLANDQPAPGGTPLNPASLTLGVTPPASEGVVTGIDYVTGSINFQPALGFVGTTNLTYSVCDQQGCCSTASVSVTVNGGITVAVDFDQTICAGDGVFLSAFSPDGTFPLTTVWSDGSIGDFVFLFPNNTTNYVATVTDANGCVGIDSALVTVAPIPNANIVANGPTQFCAGDSVSLTAGAGETYLWSNGATTQTITVTTTGNYGVTVANGNGLCLDSASRIVTVVPNPALSVVNITDAGCAGAANGTVSVAGNPVGGTYLWSNGATLSSIGGLQAGVYNVTYTFNNNCTASLTATIAQEPLPTLAVVTDTDVSCLGGNDGSAGVAGTPVGGTYSWSNGATDATISGLVAGDYGVTYTNNGCTATATVNIGAGILATVAVLDSTNVSCLGGNDGAATVGGTPFGGDYLWSNGAIGAAIGGVGAGNYSVTYTLNNCSASASVNIGDGVLVTVNAGVDISVENGDQAVLTATPDNPGFVYAWSGSDGTTFSGNPITVLPSDTTTYTVTATFGPCWDTDTVTVFWTDPSGVVQVPNAFTPNNDERNDLFFPLVEGDVDIIDFKVFNRWGQIVHDSPTQGWDGRFKDEYQARDVYIYVLVVRLPDETLRTITGDVSLVR